MTHTITIDKNTCTRCGTCARVCPSFVIQQKEKGADIEVPDTAACIACGHCIDVCPTLALRHSAFPEEKVHEVRRDLLPSPESVLELMRSRRSNRTITPQPVSEEHFQLILEAARYAPTAENSRKVGLTLITDAEAVHHVEDATMRFFLRLAVVLLNPVVKFFLKPFLADLYAQAPALMAMKEQWLQGQHPATCNVTSLLLFTAPKGYDFAAEDSNLAYQNASLMAESLGVSQVYMGLVLTALRWMGGKRAARLMGIDSHRRVRAIMGLGMPSVRYRRYTER